MIANDSTGVMVNNSTSAQPGDRKARRMAGETHVRYAHQETQSTSLGAAIFSCFGTAIALLIALSELGETPSAAEMAVFTWRRRVATWMQRILVLGTLRYSAIQQGPLWIVFSRDMTIRPRQELILNVFKTIDGRGFNVHVAGGAGLTLQHISNVIIHGVHIHEVVSTGSATIRSSPSHVEGRSRTDSDVVSIWSSRDVWIFSERCLLPGLWSAARVLRASFHVSRAWELS